MAQSYKQLLNLFKAELQNQEKYKRDTITDLAKQLEKEKHPLHSINETLSRDLEGYVTKQYIGQCLGKKYKDASKIHGKKKIEVAADGTEIEVSDEEEKKKKRNEIEDEIETEERQKFEEEFKGILESRTQGVESLDTVVMKELDTVREQKKELESKLSQTVSVEEYEQIERKLASQGELYDEIRNHKEEWLKFEENENGDLEIAEVMSADIVKDKNKTLEVKIDLRKFEDEIKDSYKKGRNTAELRITGERVIDWS